MLPRSQYTINFLNIHTAPKESTHLKDTFDCVAARPGRHDKIIAGDYRFYLTQI